MPTQSESLLTTLDHKAAPGNAALIVVDVQNDFLAAGGYFDRVGYDLSHARAAIPPLKGLLAKAREVGVPVIFIQAIYNPQVLSPAMHERNRRRKLDVPRCITGTWGADFYEVRPLPGEPVVIKHRYSAFYNTELEQALKQRGVCSLLLTGVTTDTCVESTARDGYFRDYYVTVVADCCGALSDQDHHGMLARADRDFATIATSDEVINAWERLRASGSRAPATADATT